MTVGKKIGDDTGRGEVDRHGLTQLLDDFADLRLDNGRVSFGGAIESSIGREATFRDDRAMAEMTIRF